MPTPQDVQPDFADHRLCRRALDRQPPIRQPLAKAGPMESIEDQLDFYYGNAGTILFFGS